MRSPSYIIGCRRTKLEVFKPIPNIGIPMAKKKLPKVLALLDEDMCTGCEACMTVCRSIASASSQPAPRAAFQVCTIELPRCIGCTLCHQVCPWDCITMIPTDQFLQNANTDKSRNESCNSSFSELLIPYWRSGGTDRSDHRDAIPRADLVAKRAADAAGKSIVQT